MATYGDERHTGADAIFKIGGTEYPVSNVSWDRDVNTTEVQHTGSSGGSPLKPTIAVTGLRYSGSFEYDGKNESLRSSLWKSSGEPVRGTLTVKEQAGRVTTGDDGDTASGTTSQSDTRTVTFKRVIVTGESRDIPSDDVSSTSWDWVAEDISFGGSGDGGG